MKENYIVVNCPFMEKNEAKGTLDYLKRLCVKNGHVTIKELNEMGGYVEDLNENFGWTSLNDACIKRKESQCGGFYYIALPPVNYLNSTPVEKEDMVNNPSHYTHGSMETKDKIHEALGDKGFIYWCWGTAMKYYDRANYKWNKREDLMKAAVYAQWAAETLEANPEVFK